MYKFLKPNKDIRVACDSSADYFLHSHRHAEIHYVISGTFDVFTNNKWYHLKEKSLVFIFPYQIHTTKQASGLVYGTMFNVDLLPLFSQTLLNFNCCEPILSESDNIFIEPLFKYALELYEEMPDFYHETLTSTLSVITGHILTALSKNLTRKIKSSYDFSTEKIVHYCCENFTSSEISLKFLSKELHFSESYISHIFTDKLGITFNDFINHQRIEQVCRLLRYSNKSITDISFACGFSSQATFNRVFKKIMNVSPKEYRRLK